MTLIIKCDTCDIENFLTKAEPRCPKQNPDGPTEAPSVTYKGARANEWATLGENYNDTAGQFLESHRCPDCTASRKDLDAQIKELRNDHRKTEEAEVNKITQEWRTNRRTQRAGKSVQHEGASE